MLKQLTIAILLTATCAAETLPDGPQPGKPTAPAPPASVSTIAAKPPVAARAFTPPFVLVHTALFASAAADAITTTRALRRPGAVETNPLLGSHPGDARVWGTMMVSSAGMTILDYFLKKRVRSRGAWAILPVTVTGVHAAAAGLNSTGAVTHH